MYIEIEEPNQRISSDAVKVWRISHSLTFLVELLVIAILFFCTNIFGWYNWIETILSILFGLAFLSAIYNITIQPVFLQRTWRYQVDEQFVQLKHGKWTEEHTLIPMEKVEYVKTEQGPVMRRYGLYTIEVGTTTSSHKIPAIPEDIAKQLKSQIATYAKIQDTITEEGEKGA